MCEFVCVWLGNGDGGDEGRGAVGGSVWGWWRGSEGGCRGVGTGVGGEGGVRGGTKVSGGKERGC